MNGLRAGCAKADITPPVGCQLEGYSPDIFSTEVHDPLDVKALALAEGNGQPVVLVSASVCEVATKNMPEIFAAVEDACGLKKEYFLLSSIHTHTGPNVAGSEGWGALDRPYFENIFIPGIVRAVKGALASMVPAEYAVAEGETDICVNRRERKLDGGVKLGQNPWGPADRRMTLVRFRNAVTKEGLFQMVFASGHGTANGKATVISRDWIGVMLDRLEAKTGLMTGMWNVACGDMGPRLANGKTTGNVALMEELGGYAALEAVRIAAGLEKAPYERGRLQILPSEVPLVCRPMPPRAEVEAWLAEHPDSVRYTNITAEIKRYMKACFARYEAGEEAPKEYLCPSTVVTLGDALAICPTAFELFSEIPLMVAKFSPFRFTEVLSITNGFMAYLPTRDELIRGGYEVDCFYYQMETPLADETDSVLEAAFLEILDKAYEGVTKRP